MTADGPAGLRIAPECGVCTTAWPCATLLASTWNEELVESVGLAGGMEVKENNIALWLTPAINIHRSPLCGRRFYHESEAETAAAGGDLRKAPFPGFQRRHPADRPQRRMQDLVLRRKLGDLPLLRYGTAAADGCGG